MTALPNPTSFGAPKRRRSVSAAPGDAMAPSAGPGTPQPVAPPMLPSVPPPFTPPPAPGTPQPMSPPQLSPATFRPPTRQPGHAQPVTPRLQFLQPQGTTGTTPTPLAVSPPTLSPADPAGGAVPTTPIDPTNDLRSRAVLPDATADRGARDDLTSYFGPTDVAAGSEVAPTASPRLGRFGSLVDDAAGKLGSVDRVQRAKDLLQQFDDEQAPEHELALRQITNKYLQRGGGKSGMLRTAYGNEDLVRQRDRDLMERKVIGDATEGSIADQFNKTSALSGLESGLSDREAMGRGEARGERAYRTGIDEGNLNRRLATREAVNNTATSDAARRRGEVRGERGYQNDLEQRSFERTLGQDQYEGAQQDRQLQRALALLSAGEAGNPASILASLSASGGMDPQLIASLAQMLGRGTAGGGSAGTIPAGRTLPASAGSPV